MSENQGAHTKDMTPAETLRIAIAAINGKNLAPDLTLAQALQIARSVVSDRELAVKLALLTNVDSTEEIILDSMHLRDPERKFCGNAALAILVFNLGGVPKQSLMRALRKRYGDEVQIHPRGTCPVRIFNPTSELRVEMVGAIVALKSGERVNVDRLVAMMEA